MRRITTLLALLCLAAPASAAGPAPGSPEYSQRDFQNIQDAYGRESGPNAQLTNPAYMPALVAEGNDMGLHQLWQQAASPTRPALTPGNVFPGWNVGNPLRAGWSGRRGQRTQIAYTNRYGSLIRGSVFAPLEGARDPYTGKRLKPPYPAVVITTGSVQASERMYWWLAEDLAERGYVVITYDVQGQGTSETLPHQGPVNDFPFCNPFAEPGDQEQYGCPGVPAQQTSNFVHGTTDATNFLLSTPTAPYPNPAAGGERVDSFNPYWRLVNRKRLAIVGHSLGAAAVSRVQGTDKRVTTVVALDKLGSGTGNAGEVKPRVPALAIQSEYGFSVMPYWWSHGSSITPQPGPPDKGPEPDREQAGFNAWRKAGIDTMLIVPRSSTHLDYSDIPLVLPASRYGQDLASVYIQAWFDKYLKKDRKAQQRLLSGSFGYLEPVGGGKWESVPLERSKLLSFYFCSGYAMKSVRTGRMLVEADIAGVGCAKK